MDAYIKGSRVLLNPGSLVGSGGEAEIFQYKDKAVKIYHTDSLDKRKAEKLKAFPKNLPGNLIGPQELAFDRHGNVIGFSMELIKNATNFIQLSNKKFRENFPNEKVKDYLLKIGKILKEIHSANVIVGDLNDMNLLFRGDDVFFIDADSMQFGKFPCEVATEQFLDPRLYGIDFSVKPSFTKESDFYAFAVLLFKGLLFVNPYGGVHPKFPTLLRRAEKRVSVFDPGVKYPKAANHFKILPDDLLDQFHKIFEKDLRSEFPRNLIEDLRWTKCTVCGEMHAKGICPFCAQIAPAAVKETVFVNRKCIANIVWKTSGRIIVAKAEYGKMKLVFEERNQVKREDGQLVMPANPDNFTRFSIMGRKTVIGKGHNLFVIEDEKIVGEMETGTLGNLPVFDSSSSDLFRITGEMLVRNEDRILGQILKDQTWIRAGEKFGFGFYRAGKKTIHFFFDDNGINDSLDLPKISGNLVDAECVFSEEHVLFLVSTKESGKIWNAMHLLDSKGKLIAYAKEEAVNSRMLSQIHNKALGGDKVITASDEGLMLLDHEQGAFREAKIFTDTEPFVNENMSVFLAPDGIYVVSDKSVKLLKLV